MKIAIVSDIHSNLEALTAVLEDIRSRGAERIYCLGDIIGYGANPRECVDLVMQFDLCILGNHDQGAMFDPDGFSRGAERAIFWTREQLQQPAEDREQVKARWEFLGRLPRSYRENGMLYVHGSPRNPLNEYVFPEDVFNAKKIEKIFSLLQHACFQGHTHVPGVFTEEGKFLSPQELGGRFSLAGTKAMINVGSVGQPRDGDWRACYVMLDGDEVTFYRVEYPVEQAIEKILSVPELDNFLGERLREGR